MIIPQENKNSEKTEKLAVLAEGDNIMQKTFQGFLKTYFGFIQCFFSSLTFISSSGKIPQS